MNINQFRFLSDSNSFKKETQGTGTVSHNNSRLLMWSLPLSFLVPLCLLSYVQKQVTILVHQKQFGTYGIRNL